MTLQIFDCEQGSESWYQARLGIVTASEFHTVLAKGRDGGASVTRKSYMLKLAGERITGEIADSYSNAHMERGKVMETEARSFYAFMQDQDIQQVGFIRNGDVGVSPDGLVGSNGMHEVKTKLPSILIECILKDNFPPEHMAQCQGALWVAEREWIDLSCYWPKMPSFVKRATRDEVYIKNLAGEVARFNDELAAVVERVRGYDMRAAA